MATEAEPSSHTVTLNDLRCRYLQWGAEGQPALLMLHGLRSYAHTWEAVAVALRDTYRIIALDFRGRGDSEWDPRANYFTNAYVSDLEQLVDVLGLAQFAILGHSMGGTVGYTYAARHPDQVSVLVVEDIGPGSSTETDGAQRIRREMSSTPTHFTTLAHARDYWRSVRPNTSEAALQSRIEHTLRRSPSGGWDWKLDMAGIAQARLSGDPAGPVDLWRCIADLECPTLVVRGERSDLLPVTTCVDMAARQPHLQWAEVPGAGHYVHDDNPDGYLRAVQDFLQRHAS